VELPEGPYATVVGLVLGQPATVPTGGEKVLVDGWWLEVLEVDHNAIQRLGSVQTQPTDASNDR
jgi:CBS domain containing-hemolysin-like protein